MNHPVARVRHNIETPIPVLNSEITPRKAFFVRSHFPIPTLDCSTWRIELGGEVDRCLSLGYGTLESMKNHSVTVTLECAGNGRTGFERPAPGELRWGHGAVGTAVWKGIPLGELLNRAGVRRHANQVMVRGADVGQEPGGSRTISYARRLPLEKALHMDTIIALSMNDKPLSRRQGFPARLIVPGWYGMASVKWVCEIKVMSGEPFGTFFNDKKYVYITERGQAPVTELRVKSLVTSPADGEILLMGKPVEITGKAWSGADVIKQVEVCVAGTWTAAKIEQPMGRYAWATWRTTWTPGRAADTLISSRATDAKGNIQPDEPEINRDQYGYNAPHTIRVHVR